MRDWLLVLGLAVVLVAWVVVVLLSPQVGSVPAGLSESDGLLTEALGGGSTVHESSDSHAFDLFQGRSSPSDAAADSGPPASVAEFAAHARASANSDSGAPFRTRAKETSKSPAGQRSPAVAASHRGRPGQRGDSATSMIPR